MILLNGLLFLNNVTVSNKVVLKMVFCSEIVTFSFVPTQTLVIESCCHNIDQPIEWYTYTMHFKILPCQP